MSIRDEAVDAAAKVIRDGGPIYGFPGEMAAAVVDDVLGRIAAEHNRRADGLSEMAAEAEDGQSRRVYELMAITLRNTAWAILHGDQAVNLRELGPAPEPEASDARP